MRFRALIFDFDGTLVRSHVPVYEVIERLTRRHRHVPMPTPEQFRDLGTREMLALLNVRRWQIPWFTLRARRALKPRMPTVDFEPGVRDVIRGARRAGVRIGLVSSNSRANVEHVLRRHDAVELFDVLTVGASLFGKQRHLEATVRRLGVPAAEVLTIGDETRDVDAARAAGLKVAAVGWGFHSPDRLAVARPDFAVATPADLASLVGL